MMDKSIAGEYCLDGYYKHNFKRCKLNGTFSLDAKGNLEGKINDVESKNSEQKIKGAVTIKKMERTDVQILEFLKFPGANNLCVLFYQLGKPITNGIEGEYMGGWISLALPGNAQAPNYSKITKKTGTDTLYAGSRTELKISKKQQ